MTPFRVTPPPYTVQRYADGAWSATGESVSVDSDGQFSHVITGGAAGTRYRYVSPKSGLRLRAWSDAVSVAAEVYTPSVDLTVRPVQQVSGPEYKLEYHQSQRVTGTTNAPQAPVSVEIYDYREDDLWVWSSYWTGTTAADGSFTASLPNLPEGTKVRAIVEPSADGHRKRAVSDEVTTTLTPIELTLDGPQIDVYDVTRDRGTLVEFEATAGDLITVDFADAHPAGVAVSWRLYGPDGNEVPEQQFVRGLDGVHVSRYFRPTTPGTHTLVLTSDSTGWPSSEDVRITASTPKVVPITIDQQRTVSTSRPEQLIDLEFIGSAGQAIGVWPFNVEQTCPTAQLYLGDQLVPRQFASMEGQPVQMQSAWELPLDGTYHMRLWPCDDTPLTYTITVVSPEEVELEFGKDTRIDLSRRGAYGIASFTTTAGKHIQLERIDWYWPGFEGVVVAPGGSLIRSDRLDQAYDFVAPQTGTYKLWVSPGSQSNSYAVWRATESNH